MSNFQIQINVFCVKCKQKITELDISQNNCLFILLPALNFQHQVCPLIHSFTYSANLKNSLNLNINLQNKYERK